MRKQTHLKKAVSLALAAAMAVSVCTTALAADDSAENTAENTVAAEMQDAGNEETNPTAGEPQDEQEDTTPGQQSATDQGEDTEEAQDAENTSDENSAEEDATAADQPATQSADANADNGVAVQDGESTTVATVGNKNYSSIDDALTEWKTQGGILTLLQDCTATKDKDSGNTQYLITASDATLDLNGHTLTLKSNQTGVYFCMSVEENASLTIKDSKYTSTPGNIMGTTNNSLVKNKNKLTVTNCKISQEGSTSISNDGTLNIQGGADIAAIRNYGEVNLSSGKVGTITMYGNSVFNVGTTGDKDYLNVQVDTIDDKYYNGTVNFNSGIVGHVESSSIAIFNFYGSVFKDKSAPLPAGCAFIETPYEGKIYYKVEELTKENAAAKVGENALYASLQDAAKQVSDGGKITLLKDYTGVGGQDGQVKINASNVTLDLNGHSITNNNYGTAVQVYNAGGTFCVTNSSGTQATIEGNIPIQAVSGTVILEVSVGSNIVLKASNDRGRQIDLGGRARMEDTAENRALIGNLGGYLTVTASDNKKYIYDIASIDRVAEVADKATMLGNYTYASRIQYAGDKPFYLDLGGYTYTYTEQGNAKETVAAIYIGSASKDGSLTVTNGTINATGAYAAGALVLAKDYSLTLDNVTITSKNNYGISTNGSTSDNVKITLNDSQVTSNATHAIFFPGGSELTIKGDNTVIKGATTGIEIRAGKLTVNGGTITGGTNFASTSNNNGTTTNGVGIAVAQHTTKLPIDVTINNATVSGAYALYEKCTEANAVPSFVKVTVNGGKFSGKVYSEDVTKFVSGGDYTDKVDASYIVEGKACNPLLPAEDGYNFRIGAIPEEGENIKVDTEVKEPTTDVTGEASNVSGDVKKEDVKKAAEEIKVSDASTDAVKDAVKKESNSVATSEKVAADAVAKMKEEGVKVEETDTVVIVTEPKLIVTPKAAVKSGDTKSMTFDIKLVYDIKATTDVTKMDASNTVTVAENQVVTNPPKMDITIGGLDVLEIAPSEFTNNNLYVKHEKDRKLIGYHRITSVKDDGTHITAATFTNDKGFSDFTFVCDSRKATIVVDGKTVTVTPADVGSTLPHADKDGYTWNGVQFSGINGTYTTLTDALLTDLSGKGNVTGTSVYTENPVTTTPVVTPAPDTNLYYTCVACGYHDWTATDEGYKCNHCGHLESVKQLAGYANVKGVYTPKTSSSAAKAKVTSSAIPQTSDEMPIVPIAIIAIAALLGLGVTVYMKKRG